MLKPPTAFSSLEGMLELDRHDGMDMRPTLLRVLTDLPARKALAARLAPYPAAPRAVIARLARDVLEVAEPILTQSPCLTPADLKAITEERGPTYAAIIATRGQPALPSEHASPAPMQANASAESEA